MKSNRFDALTTKHGKTQVDLFASKFSLSFSLSLSLLFVFLKFENVEMRKQIVLQNAVGIRLNNQLIN